MSRFKRQKLIKFEILTRVLPTFLKKIIYFYLFLIVYDEGMTFLIPKSAKPVTKMIFDLNQTFNCENLFILLPQNRFLYKKKSVFGI
jgi:hypothetical protein